MPPLPDRAADASAGRGRRRLKVRVGCQASFQPPSLINLVPWDQSADEEAAANEPEGGGTTICPLRDGSSRDGRWGDDSTSRGGRDDEEARHGRAWPSSGNDDGLPVPLDVSAFKLDVSISWRPCRARLKAVQEDEDKQNNGRGVREVRVEHGVEHERRPSREKERTERRRVRFGASDVLRCLTLVTLAALAMPLPGAEGVGVAHRSLLNTGNPDAKRLYDDLLSNYNKLVRPVVNTTDPLTVRIKLKLSQLIDVVRAFLPARGMSVVAADTDSSISATTATMSKLWKGGRGGKGGGEDSVTSVMIGTQLQHVRSFIIDGWLFSLPFLCCTPVHRNGGRGRGKQRHLQFWSNLELKLSRMMVHVALDLILDRHSTATGSCRHLF